MTSNRHSTELTATRTSTNRVDDAALLDATRACVLAVGVRRTTLTDVARRAGVSRMTLYRRVPDVRSLVTALMTREFGALLQDAAKAASQLPTARQRLVAGAVDAARALVSDPLLRRVLELDAELMLPYIVDRLGSTQRIAEQFVREQIVVGHGDGSVRQTEPLVQARLLYLTVQAVVLSMRPATADLAQESLLAELATQLDAALRPTLPGEA
ncbi:TetR/AcrR family transcriptional regulator [Solihabitans fulvus]|uniref:TetR/AcrR family transcriptional regulator n=1 Tax=Solihabitans fulvus TaxID=1892852 RepID=A0A5B2XJJ1_9PSEU|nr:TetR/AcrR family transcriptional regulator [Solihabitans fulvus]KAA2263000.1 TetR/AcrR family transcriptional regulator [Solihabitans fulvus]